MRRLVLNLNSTRPVWRPPPELVQRLSATLGGEWEIISIDSAVSSDGDGAGASSEVVAAVASAEVYVGWGVPAEVVRVGRRLAWVHTGSAGVGGSLTPELRDSDIIFTNSRGIHADPIADWVLAAICYFARGLDLSVAGQQRREWVKDRFTDGGVALRELADLNVGIIGVGGIGTAVAKRCAALGMRVSAVRNRKTAATAADFDWIGGPDDVLELAATSDVLVVAAPRTPTTEGLIGEEVLAALPTGAYVINVSRGELLDEKALVRTLDSGHLGGAALDVFREEPLPAASELWDHARVLIGPHVSAVTDRFWERETKLLEENAGRYLAGEALLNVVDQTMGY